MGKNIKNGVCLPFSLENDASTKKKKRKEEGEKPQHLLAIANQYSACPA